MKERREEGRLYDITITRINSNIIITVIKLFISTRY